MSERDDTVTSVRELQRRLADGWVLEPLHPGYRLTRGDQEAGVWINAVEALRRRGGLAP